MEKYMLNKFPYFGIQKPQRVVIYKGFFAANGLPAPDELESVVKALWNLPQREYQYFANTLLEKFINKVDKEFIETYEWLLLEKSWWDTVDLIAAKLVGGHFKRFPELIGPMTEKWMASGNMWLQRSALLFQLKYKSQTDTELLFRYILQLSASKEFFIQKAIGWMLREYSKTDADTVVHFVESHELAALSKREALKWLKNRS